MRRVWQIARRDFIESVRSPTFIILVLIVPVILVISIAVPRLLEESADPSRFALVDLPQEWSSRLMSIYESDTDAHSDLTLTTMDTPAGGDAKAHRDALADKVRATELFGYVTVEENANGERTAAITTRTAGQDDGARWLSRTLPAIIRSERAARLGVQPEIVAQLDAPVSIRSYLVPVAAGTEGPKAASETDRFAAWAPMIFTYLLWIVVFSLTQRLLVAMIEEKSNRTIEIILSSCSPMEFMAGKVLGGIVEGVVVLAVWLSALFLAAAYFSNKYLHGLDLTVFFARRDHLALFTLYFILGYVMFAAIIVGLGSLCNTIKDTQGLMTPIMLVMMAPVLVMTYVGQHPETALSIGLSWVPFFTPFLMMNRVAANPPAGPLEIVGSFILLGVTIWVVVWASSKLFRVGILMYGKTPRLREIIKLLHSREARAIPRAD